MTDNDHPDFSKMTSEQFRAYWRAYQNPYVTNQNRNSDQPPDFNKMTRDEYRAYWNLKKMPPFDFDKAMAEHDDRPWYSRILTPGFRRWAYGVAAAAVVAYAAITTQPQIVPIALPLIMAIIYVTPEGDPR